MVLWNRVPFILTDVPLQTSLQNLYVQHNVLCPKSRKISYNVALFMDEYFNKMFSTSTKIYDKVKKIYFNTSISISLENYTLKYIHSVVLML